MLCTDTKTDGITIKNELTMSEKSISGICSFPNWIPQQVYEPYSHVRFFMESKNHLSENGELATQSWLSAGRGKFLDDDLKQTFEAGKKIILCLQGDYPWMNPGNTTYKKRWPQPLDATEEEKLNPDNYGDSEALAAQLAVVYSDDCDEATAKRILKPYQQPNGSYGDNPFRYALGYVDALEGPGNEYDFQWSGVEPQSPEVAAAGAMAWYRGVRSASQTMKVLLPSNVGQESEGGGYGTDSLRRLAKKFNEFTGGNHHDVYLNAHLYPREGDWGPALNPEEFAVEFFDELTAICEDYRLSGWYVTEIGVATKETSSDPQELKQRVKDMDGLNLEEAQAAWWRRLMLIAQAYPECQAITFWMCRDNYDTGQHRYSGRYRGEKADWTDAVEKDGGDIIRAIADQEYLAFDYAADNTLFAVHNELTSDEFDFDEGIVWATNEQTHERFGKIGPVPKLWKADEVPEPGPEPEDEVLEHLIAAAAILANEYVQGDSDSRLALYFTEIAIVHREQANDTAGSN